MPGENKNPTPQPESNKKQELLKLIREDANDAGWRLAGKQFIKMTREPLVAFLTRNLGGDDTMRAKIAAFLETDLGEGLLATLLSMGLSALPETTGDIPKRLARELRVHAMTDVGDVVADLMMGPLRQVAVMYLQGSPGADKLQSFPLGNAESKPSASQITSNAHAEQPQPVAVGSGKSNNI